MGERTKPTFCQEHLSPLDRKAIAKGLFTESSCDENRCELIGLCPFHGEKNASFSYNWDKDIFNCFGCTAKGDLIDLWCHAHGYNRKDGGFKKFCEEHNIHSANSQGLTRHKKGSAGQSAKPKNQPPADKIDESDWKQDRLPLEGEQEPEKKEYIIPEEEWDKLPPLPEDMILELIRRRSWTREVIAKLDLRLYVHDKEGAKLRRLPFGERRVAIPVRDDEGRLRNVRFYASFGTKDTYFKITSWAKDYGTARLLPPPSSWGTGPLWYCEGEPDWICALSQGLNAITKTIGAKTHKKEWNKHFRGRDVIFCYDADKTGLYGAEKGAVMLSKEAESVRVLMWPRFMYMDNEAPKHDGKSDFSTFVMTAGEEYPQDHGWDLTDFITKFGKSERDLRDLLPSAKTFSRPKHEEAEMGGAARFFGGDRGTSFRPVLLAKAYLKDHDIVTDTVSGKPFLWNGQYFEQYNEQHIKTAATLMLEDEAKTNYVNDATNIILNLAALEYGREMNDRPEMICLKNGMFNLNTGELVPHAREYLCSSQLGVHYDPKVIDPECPVCSGSGKVGELECPECWGRGVVYRCSRWIQFLKETIQVKETILQLQEFFGYCLLREVRFKKSLLLTGPGDDGKSKVIDILQALVGEDNTSAISLSELEKPFSRAMLYNKALNVAAEIESDAIHSEVFKRLVAGDSITAEFKHKDGFSFRYWGKLVFAANNPPRFLDNSDGLFTRFIIIRFKQSFPEGDPRRDPYLDVKLKAELGDIFLWALDGLERLMKQQRFTASEDSNEALLDFKRSNNPLLCWTEDRLLYRPNHALDLRLGCDAAYEDYKKYCEKYRYKALGYSAFGRGLRGVFKSLGTGRLKGPEDRAKCYMGLTLASSTEAARIEQEEALLSGATAAESVPSSPSPSSAGVPHIIEGGADVN